MSTLIGYFIGVNVGTMTAWFLLTKFSWKWKLAYMAALNAVFGFMYWYLYIWTN